MNPSHSVPRPSILLRQALAASAPALVQGPRPLEQRRVVRFWSGAAHAAALLLLLGTAVPTARESSPPPPPTVSAPLAQPSLSATWSGTPGVPYDGATRGLKGLQAQGWPAAAAWVYYREIQSVGPDQWVAPEAPSALHRAQSLRTDLADRLTRIRTPNDLHQYLLEWSNRSLPYGTPSDRTDRTYWLHVGVDPALAALRMASPGRVSSWDQGLLDNPVLDWRAVLAQAGADDQALASGEAPPPPALGSLPEKASIDGRAGQAAIAHAMQISGVRVLRLPFAATRDQATLMATAQQVIQANDELSHRTRWTGPVLGLGHTTSVLLGDLDTDQDGATVWDAQGHTITLGATMGWGALAHEWFHGLDLEIGRHHGAHAIAASAAGAMDGSAEAFLLSRLARALTHPLPSSSRAAWEHELTSNINSRWPQPEDRSNLTVLRQRIRQGSSPADLLNEELAVDPRRDQPDHVTALRRGMAMELAEAVDMQRGPPRHLSPWFEALTAMDRASVTVPTDSKDTFLQAPQGALSTPTERLAYAFESEFPSGALIAATPAGQAPLRTPLAAEAAVQRPQFDRMFRALDPWWTSVSGVGPSSPVRRSRRNASP